MPAGDAGRRAGHPGRFLRREIGHGFGSVLRLAQASEGDEREELLPQPGTVIRHAGTPARPMQQRLYFLPLPQGHGSLRPAAANRAAR